MKVEDLMIGDWYWWEAEGKKYPLQVTKDTFKLLDEDILNFQSITLTPEILEKNANRHYNEHIYDIYCFFNEKNNFNELVEITLINGFFIWSINGYEYSITEIKYVHELQHALRLCGINKEIVV